MSGTVTVFVVSPDTRSERRYDLHLTVGQLKTKLESVTGIPVSAQQITLHNNEDDSAIATLDDDSKPLGFYSLRDWQALKVSKQIEVIIHPLFYTADPTSQLYILSHLIVINLCRYQIPARQVSLSQANSQMSPK